MKLLSWLEEETSLPKKNEPDRNTVYQLAVLVRDASGSMIEPAHAESEDRPQEEKIMTKAEAASKASYGLMMELARPENEDGFYISVIDFSDSAFLVHPPTKATNLSREMKDITIKGGTDIREGLYHAERTLKNFKMEGRRFLRPVVVLFSDGIPTVGDPLSMAERLKTKVDVVAVAFGLNADEELLKKIATSPDHFYRCVNGKELRRFFMKVGRAMSRTRAKKVNATKALSGITGYQLEAGEKR